LTGAGVRIGIVDSGVNRNHPALAGRVLTNYAYINGNTNNLRVDDVVGHGTVVAQLAAGAAAGSWPGGIAPGAGVLSARIIADKSPTDDGSGKGNEVDGALGFLPIHNDLIAGGMRIMNNSWGGLYWTNRNATAPIASEYRPFIFNNDGLVVFAAGNDGRANPSDMAALPSQTGPNGSLPAADLERGWLTVAALDTANPDQLASYSNACGVAARYCLAAPGTAAYIDPAATSSTGMTYYYGRGTSYAAPLVSGAAALVWEAFPYFSNDAVRQTLLGTATDLGAPGIDAVYGNGLLNIAAAIKGPQRLDFGELAVDLRGQHSIWGNTLSGAGGLRVSGDGYLDLGNASHTYSGATRLLGGTLAVNALGNTAVEITAPGRLLVASGVGGSIDNRGSLHLWPGDALSVAVGGDYRHDSGATLILQAGEHLQVAGKANLLGGTVSITGKRDYVSMGQSYDILRAAGGVSGQFSSLSSPASTVFVDGRLDYRADGVSLWLNRLDVVATASVLGNVTAASLGSAQRLEAAFQRIDANGSAVQVADGFVRAAGDIQAIGSSAAAVQTLDSLSGQLHGQALAASLDALALERQTLANQVASGQPVGSWRVASASALNGSQVGSGWQADGWIQGQGLDLGNGLQAGLAVARSQLSTPQAADRSLDRQQHGHLWLAGQQGRTHWLASLASGQVERRMDRQLQLGSQRLDAHSRYQADLHSVSVQAGQQWRLGRWQWQPAIGLAWEQLRSDGFNEADAVGLGLRSAALDMRRTSASAGLTGITELAGWQLQAQLQWQQVLDNQGSAWLARYTGVDAWSALDTSALGQSHGLAGVQMARELGPRAGVLRLGWQQRLGKVPAAQGASLLWQGRF
jgi:autotransporter-associated beta strand protein